MLRYLSAGESHGKALFAIVEGMPAGVKLDFEEMNKMLRLRQGGYGRGKRMQIETDSLEILTGVRDGKTTGSPITLSIKNKDWENWQEIMAVDKVTSNERIVTKPRPGHADLPGAIKYRHKDIRNILERASARETAIRVAVGALTKELLNEFAIRTEAQVESIGGVVANMPNEMVGNVLYENELYCPDNKATEEMKKKIDEAKKKGDSLGGTFRIHVEGLVPGLGSHVQWDRRVDGLLAQALMGIPGIKGVEFGLGFRTADLPGSEVHDEIAYDKRKGFYHLSNNAGGVEGGITNGEPLIIRAAMKPIPTLMSPLKSADIITKEPFLACVERSDVCAVPAAAIVGEAVVSWALAGVLMEKFGGDHVDEVLANYESYKNYIREEY